MISRTDGSLGYVTDTITILKWNKIAEENHALYSLLYVFDEDFSLQIVLPDFVVEVSQQVWRHHDVNWCVQFPGAGPEVQLPTQTYTELI
jgi:hypothetical protein